MSGDLSTHSVIADDARPRVARRGQATTAAILTLLMLAACEGSAELLLPPNAVQVAPAMRFEGEDAWAAQAILHRGAVGQVFQHTCPPNGRTSDVWGTLVYTDDSSVCTAAVHAGLITLQGGGVVRIVIRPGLPAYTASGRNGVMSQRWDEWDGSFAFVGP